jgi:hypothetical protein
MREQFCPTSKVAPLEGTRTTSMEPLKQEARKQLINEAFDGWIADVRRGRYRLRGQETEYRQELTHLPQLLKPVI